MSERMMELWEVLQEGLPLSIEDRKRLGCGLEIICRYMQDGEIDTHLLKKAMQDIDRAIEKPDPDALRALREENLALKSRIDFLEGWKEGAKEAAASTEEEREE